MGVIADSQRVEEHSEDGDLAFSVRWSDLQRITAWRMCIPDEPCFVMLEIAPDPVTGTDPHCVYEGNANWQSWIDALTKHVPGFTIDVVRSALDLPEGQNAVHVLLRARQNDKDDDDSAASSIDEALYEWLDEVYEANQAVFQRPEKATPEQAILISVYNLQAEVLNGGWHQYFGNSTADDLPNLRRALRKIGASSALNLLKTACGLFPRGSPGRTQDTRLRQLEKMSAKRLQTMEELDSEFQDIVAEILAKLKAYWIESN
jgi:hypothetical protein